MKRFLSRQHGGLVLAATLLPTLAHAHPADSLAFNCASGVAHPLHGLDDFAAMIAVGVWAAQLGGRARWLLPATFLATMSAGAVLGTDGILLPAVEPMIAASVLVFGLLIATTLRLPPGISLGLTALFALAHGTAHGAEIPAGVNALPYGIGFLTATAVLHTVGLGAGTLLTRSHPAISRVAGAVCAVTGLGLLLS